MNKYLKPLVKYQGGKSRELKLIHQLLPQSFNKIIEPFCGGAAVSFSIDKSSILGDINKDIINLYHIVQDINLYNHLQEQVDSLKELEHNELEKVYYSSRDLINQSWENVNTLERALAYIVVRQLCFSGMERYNSKGEFNVPFGHYKKFSCNLSPEHHHYLKNKCEVYYSSFEKVIQYANENDFIFIDPPYLERLGYKEGDGGYLLHCQLLNCLKQTKAKWLLIHSDNEFYIEEYKEFNILNKDFCYSQIFGKNKNHSNAKVQHLYIRNYECATF